MLPLEFRAEVNREATRVMALSSSEGRMIVALVILTQHATDGQTDGQNVGDSLEHYNVTYVTCTEKTGTCLLT